MDGPLWGNIGENQFLSLLGTIHLRRRHVLGGEGGSPLPMFADARGVGVLGLPTSAIFGHLINNPKMFNGATDDLAIKPCIPH